MTTPANNPNVLTVSVIGDSEYVSGAATLYKAQHPLQPPLSHRHLSDQRLHSEILVSLSYKIGCNILTFDISFRLIVGHFFQMLRVDPKVIDFSLGREEQTLDQIQSTNRELGQSNLCL